MSDIKIIATKVNVAFHTIFVTVTISVRDTTPVIIAKSAPATAVIPIFNPFGCQITKLKL